MIDYRPSPRRPFFAPPPPPNMNIQVPELETRMPVFDPRLDPLDMQPHQVIPADQPPAPQEERSVLKRDGESDLIRRLLDRMHPRNNR